MYDCNSLFQTILHVFYGFFQVVYLISFLTDLYILTRPKDIVDMKELVLLGEDDYPFIILLYPVLKEPKEVMKTSFRSMAKLNYPKNRFRIISIPNTDDLTTIQSLKELQKEFAFLEIMEIPPTTDPSWHVVWDNWDQNKKAYWWHVGKHAKNPNLPPKKTRQLIYAFYHLAKETKGDFLLNYIDADTCLPVDHFLAAAVGIRHYDVLQATNIAGNLNDSLAASFHALDHLIWDGYKYPHLSAHGKHPYWVLGKALFYKASDLLALGGLHPWMAIEDPEIGLRLWKNGKRLGIIEKPVIEEVPRTFRGGIVQRKRWVCGFFQTLSEPMERLNMTFGQKLLAWSNFVPCLLLWTNVFSWPFSLWAFIGYLHGYPCLSPWLIYMSLFNIASAVTMLLSIFVIILVRTWLVLGTWRARFWYMLRINPLTAIFWWMLWIIPLCLGFNMFRKDGGLVWVRTTKVNANVHLFKNKVVQWFHHVGGR
ncbi:MAG TPA: glycosyltransferase family 2 protein [Chlamydiales bacterium]|nr:MAG: glycosyl transferase [Verrucomicrobia bacterium RIFCSPHIGHO2_12_FULL_41_10]HLB52562.1 glycosyltransferase family 2 protein [Chlamydiales bacterium]